MEPSRDYPTPYPGKARQRPFTRSSMKEQENKASNELSGATAVTLRREKHVSSVSRSVNTFDLSVNDKPSRPSRRLSVPSKYATPVSKSEAVPTISENKSTTAKPSPLYGASLIKAGKSSGTEDKAKASTKTLSTSFQVSSVKTQGKANGANKDTLSSTPGSSRSSASTMLLENSSCWQRRKFSTLMSSSYWLTQIKLSESAGMHAVSLGFFQLALKSSAEPFQRLCNELKSYARKHNVLQLESDAKDVLESYGLLQEVMSSEIGEQLVVTEDSGKGFLVESKGFVAGINEVCSPVSKNHEEKSTGVTNLESSKIVEDECQAVFDTSRLHILPALKDVLHPSSEESEVCSSKDVDGEVAHGNDNMQEIVQEVRSNIKVLSDKANLTEGKGNGHRKRHNIAQTSVLKHKICTEKGDLIATGKMECVGVTASNGSIPSRKKIIQKRTKSLNAPAIKSQMSVVRKSLDGESAEQAVVPNTSRCRTSRHSCIIITTKNEPHGRKNYRQLDKKDGALSQSGLPSHAENGTEECNENLDSQHMDQLSKHEGLKDLTKGKDASIDDSYKEED